MPSTYSPNLRLELQATGENRSTWGNKANNDFSLIEQAIAGYIGVEIADADMTLTAINGATDQSRYAILNFTGTLTANRTVTIQSVSKIYIVKNSTSGGFSVNIKTSPGSPFALTNGVTRTIYCDGTSVFLASDLQTQATLSVDNKVVHATKSGNYTAVAADNNAYHTYTAAATVSLTAAATLGSGWHYTVNAQSASITIDPNGSETINGSSTLTVATGWTCYVICDGTNFTATLTAPVSYYSAVSDYRNKLINPGFDINQRGSASYTTSGAYTFDRWLLGGGAGSANTISRNANTPTQDELDAYTLTWARGTVGSTASFIIQRIEDVRTCSNKKVTVTFDAFAAAATDLGVAFNQLFGTGGSPSANVNIALQTVAVTTATQRFRLTFNIPSISGKTIGTDLNSSLEFFFTRSTTQSNPTTTISISRVSVVEGDATGEDDPFSRRHIQQEIALCQRYYQVVRYQHSGWVGVAGQNCQDTFSLPVFMMTVPTTTLISAGTNSNVTTISLVVASSHVVLSTVASAAGAAFNVFNRVYGLDAEL